MAKPLVSSSLFSFPKFLFWAFPLLVLIIYTWLTTDLSAKVGTLTEIIVPKLEIRETKPLMHGEAFVPDFVLSITQEKYTQSCITKENVILVNGTFPGPEIRLTEGQIHWIRVYNDMDQQNLTMHWHGLSMAVSPFSDGTPGASQWPIPPRHYFDYELKVEAGHAGTYFYHSHVGFQAVTASGPLIVEEAGSPPYDYDEERIIVLSDLFLKTDSMIEEGLLGDPFQWSGESANVLVNGKGHMAGNDTSPECELATISVEPDKTYRFRFIGGTALSFVSLGFEGHDQMTLIEADGDYTKPVDVSYLQIGSGQRFSVLFKTKPLSEVSAKKTHFFMQIETRERPTLTSSHAILSYRLPISKRVPAPPSPKLVTPHTAPITLPPTTLGWLDHQLESFFPSPDFPLACEVTRCVTIRTHQISGSGRIIWAQDNEPWIETFPKEPYLVSLYSNDFKNFPNTTRAHLNGGIDPVTRTFPADIGEVIEIVIQNTGSDSGSGDVHPFHAHGAHYYDLGSGNGTYDAAENEKRIAGKSLSRRDTTMLYRYAEKMTPGIDMGWRAWRLRITEPGVWMIHCHILQHMVMGMQTVWVMGNETEIMKIPIDDVQGYLTYGGNVNGNETHHPHVVHFKGNEKPKSGSYLQRIKARWNNL